MPQIGEVVQFATVNGQALSSGSATPLFSPQTQLTKTGGDIRSILFELSLTTTPIASDTMVSVQGTLGAIANFIVKDNTGKIVKNFTGPQLAYWYWLRTRKTLTNPAVAGTAAATTSVVFRLPMGLPAAHGPYQVYVSGAPFGEIATLVASASVSLTLSQEFGPSGPYTEDTFLALQGLAVGTNDITNQIPQGVNYSHMSLVLNADTDFKFYDLNKNGLQVYNQLGLDWFAEVAFAEEPNYAQSNDNRPAGLVPIPYAPFGRGTGDTVKLSLTAVSANTDPHSGVNLGSAYNPYAILTVRSL